MRYRRILNRLGLGLMLSLALLLGTPKETVAIDCFNCHDQCFSQWYGCVAGCDSLENFEERNACVFECDMADHNCTSRCFNYCFWI